MTEDPNDSRELDPYAILPRRYWEFDQLLAEAERLFPDDDGNAWMYARTREEEILRARRN